MGCTDVVCAAAALLEKGEYEMTLFGMRDVKLEDVDEVREFTASEIARGLREGTNVADLQQALNDSHTGWSEGTGDMLRALGRGDARLGEG